MVPRTTRSGRSSCALAITAALAAAAVSIPTATPATADPAAGPGSGTGPGTAPGSARGCTLVRLAEPRGGGNGGVMDIERVDGRTVYYGSTYRFDAEGAEHQRALVWFGRTAEPVRVGPKGWHNDIALELTETGLVNGLSENADASEAVAWVQDLRTMELSYFDLDSGPTGADHGFSFIRRINDQGAAAGMVTRTADPEEWRTHAVGFADVDSPLTLLPGSAESRDAGALGINNAGQRVGFLANESWPDNPDWNIWVPVLWEPDGTVTELARPHGIEAAPRAVKNDGSVSGSIVWGHSAETMHFEAAYWPTPQENVGLGVLPGGGWSDAFGMDEGGWLVGAMDRVVDPEQNPMGPDGFVFHGFLWTPDTSAGTVRLLPSLYAERKGVANWRKWVTGAVHAVNADLDQAGTGTHVGYREGRPTMAPTVFLRASRCGREVATTHDPFGLDDGAERSASSAGFRELAAARLDRATAGLVR